ncbi:MAG: hypothetical protein ABIH72_00715 [archaeon]
MGKNKKSARIMKKFDKNYKFNESHNKDKPLEVWFQDSEEGKILFIVFYTQTCRWSQCLGCNLPSAMSENYIGFKHIIKQIDYIFKLPKVKKFKEIIKKVIVSNNGSVLDERTFSSTALIYLIAMLNIHLKNLSIVSLETRPEYVDLSELEFLSRVLNEGETHTNLEIAIGFEAFDRHIRNKVFRKGLELRTFESLVKKLANYKFNLKCYFMQKPVPGMGDKEAVEDIKKGIDYLSKVAKKHKVKINMHLNPTYVAKGTMLEKEFRKGKYTPPQLIDVLRAVKYGRNKNITIFVGLYDEHLAVKDGSFIRKGDQEILKKLQKFNKTQDYNTLN